MIPAIAGAFGAKPGVLAGFPVDAGVMHEITLTNTNGAGTSSGLHRVGIAFEKGDVPAGYVLQAEINDTTIRSSMMQTNTWSDGSLKSCILAVDAGTFTASQAKTIEVTAVLGTQSTSGFDPWPFITNLVDDLTVEIRNHTGSDNNTDVGDIDFSLQAALGITTRREIQEDTPLCVRVYVWQRVTPDEHLICLNYVDIWLSDDPTPVALAYEWTPVLSQHWWVDDPFGMAMTKQLRNYDATIKQGTTTLESHTGLAHAYYTRWAGLRTDNDDQHARRLWFDEGSTAMPTLNLAYSLDSKKRMMRAGYLPPAKQDLSSGYNKSSSVEGYQPTSTYVPLGDTPGTGALNHRIAINGQGGYNGRSVLTNHDLIALADQGASDWRVARVSAQAGLAVFFHIRDHRAASGGGDATGKIIPSSFATLGAKSYAGLAAETVAVAGTGSTLVEDDAVGGGGEFVNWDLAHHTSYSFFVAFAEGERYLADAALSAADFLHHGNSAGSMNFNNLQANSKVFWAYETDTNPPGRAGLPATNYGVLPNSSRQERAWGWALTALDHAICLKADSDTEGDVFANSKTNFATWWEDSIDTFGASQLAKGALWTRSPPEGKGFMVNLSALGAIRSAILAEGVSTGISEGRDLLFALAKAITQEKRFYAAEADFHLRHDESDTTGWTGYQSASDLLFFQSCDWQNSTTIRVTHREGLNLVVDDTCIPYETGLFGTNVGGSDAKNSPPTELTRMTTYHVVSAVDVSTTQTDIEISATQSGPALTLTDPVTKFGMGFTRAVDLTTPEGNNSRYVGGPDTFLRIYNATVEYAIGAGVSGLTAQEITDFRTFVAAGSPDGSAVALFNFDGDLML